MMRAWLLALAFPKFPCCNCIGMKEHGCYCEAMGASAPGCPPTAIQLWAKLWLQMGELRG